MKSITLLLTCAISSTMLAQNYTSYHTGNQNDIVTGPHGGVCLMGGATEDDNAMTWFLQRADGGDVLVLRASGSDGYNDYFYTQLGVTLNSVETIVFNDASASNESYIHQKIQNAEAIWFAGGDQWDYISYWRNTTMDSLINDAISNRNIVIGGTSAGMAIQGGFYFSAQYGTITSAAALTNPFDTNLSVDSLDFLNNNYLHNVITDTHYDNPDRKGRHVTFLSRILTTYGIDAKGIACDEYVAVCIDPNGTASVYGDHPNYDDNAFFIQTNCELTDVTPETCSPNTPLDWNHNGEALKVYAVKGTPTGVNYLNLNDWKTGSGGEWQHWYVSNGTLMEQPGTAPNCTNEIANDALIDFKIFPNPAHDYITVSETIHSISIINQMGQLVLELKENQSSEIDISKLYPGIYTLKANFIDGTIGNQKLIIQH